MTPDLSPLRRTAVAAGLLLALATPTLAQLPVPPEPFENETTPEKAILGKILFWEEQLSADNSVACGTCHLPEWGGGDFRHVRTAGPDGILFTDDDAFGSPGVPKADVNNRLVPDPGRGFLDQITRRNSPSFIGAQYFTFLFWDGRADTRFVDPQTGLESIENLGGLESQAVEPIVSPVKMGHEGRTWDEVTRKLGRIRPLALAADVPADIVDALGTDPTYPDLFATAFGDPAITAERIAFAIASYERILIPDDTPWDRFNQGDLSALTPDQQEGLFLFESVAGCTSCHPAPLFADDLFRNIGLRSATTDPGRMEVTGSFLDRGRFKTPGLRNVALRPRLMHDGSITSLREILAFYNRGGDFTDNRDAAIFPLGLSLLDRARIQSFLELGLLDQRVLNRQPPFDRPTLQSELVSDGRSYGTASPGSGGFVPEVLFSAPAAVANPDYRLGLFRGLGGAEALLLVSTNPLEELRDGVPFNVDPDQARLMRPFRLRGAGPGQGHATFKARIPDDPDLVGSVFFAQWFVQDPAATGGVAASRGERIEVF